jgi:hypothetical protein
MNYEIVGSVVESESGRAVSGVAVSAFDRDPLFDDPLGEVLCDDAGRFRIVYDERSFRDLGEKAPDVYLNVRALDGKLLHSTKDATRENASKREEFRIELSRAVIDKVGLVAVEPLPKGEVLRSALTRLTCLEGAGQADRGRSRRQGLGARDLPEIHGRAARSPRQRRALVPQDGAFVRAR